MSVPGARSPQALHAAVKSCKDALLSQRLPPASSPCRHVSVVSIVRHHDTAPQGAAAASRKDVTVLCAVSSAGDTSNNGVASLNMSPLMMGFARRGRTIVPRWRTVQCFAKPMAREQRRPP